MNLIMTLNISIGINVTSKINILVQSKMSEVAAYSECHVLWRRVDSYDFSAAFNESWVTNSCKVFFHYKDKAIGFCQHQ